jgi:hypothetical protein
VNTIEGPLYGYFRPAHPEGYPIALEQFFYLTRSLMFTMLDNGKGGPDTENEKICDELVAAHPRKFRFFLYDDKQGELSIAHGIILRKKTGKPYLYKIEDLNQTARVIDTLEKPDAEQLALGVTYKYLMQLWCRTYPDKPIPKEGSEELRSFALSAKHITNLQKLYIAMLEGMCPEPDDNIS